MNLWLPTLTLAALVVAALLAVVQVRRRRGARLQLRVLAGRRRLLGEEIADRLRQLAAAQPQDTAAIQVAANSQLDGIHAGLIDREAHLQNLDELARLQRHKMSILERQRHAVLLEAQTSGTESSGEVAADASTETTDGPAIPERREDLEDRLLEHLQQRGDAPPPARRRRRR